MITMIPIRYHNRHYPSDIVPAITEVAGHFDIKTLSVSDNYSLHTEYSWGRRAMNSPYVDKLATIRSSTKDGIPLLWSNAKWAIEFYEFIKDFTRGNTPTIIEIHPPFKDYCPDIHEFINRYKVFEEPILNSFPNVRILLENRLGSRYSVSDFLISNSLDLVNLVDCIKSNSLKLRIALDIPQLMTANGGISNLKVPISSIFSQLMDIKEYIQEIHIWGKKRDRKDRWASHVGDLNTYCENPRLKEDLLNAIHKLCDDDYPRYFLPEVNSNDDDLFSIVKDLKQFGFSFI